MDFNNVANVAQSTVISCVGIRELSYVDVDLLGSVQYHFQFLMHFEHLNF